MVLIKKTIRFIASTSISIFIAFGCSPAGTLPETEKVGSIENGKELVAQSGFVKADGAKLYYEDVGAGPAVIFVHGSAGHSGLWEKQVDALEVAGFRVITFDLRTAGRSQSEPTHLVSSSIAQDIEAVRVHLNIEKVYIVGQALGAEGALEYALSYRRHVAGIVIAATYRGAASEPEFVALRDRLAPPSDFKGRTGLQMRLSEHYIQNDPEGVKRFVALDKANSGEISVEGQVKPKRISKNVQSTKIDLNYANLGKIEVPVLVLSAERDDITPPALMRELAAHIPNAKYATVADAGRYAFWENPENFNTILIDFLLNV